MEETTTMDYESKKAALGRDPDLGIVSETQLHGEDPCIYLTLHADMPALQAVERASRYVELACEVGGYLTMVVFSAFREPADADYCRMQIGLRRPDEPVLPIDHRCDDEEA